MINAFDVGTLVRVAALFQTAAGVATDPGGVVFKVKKPSGTVLTYTYGVGAEVVKDSTGNYHVDVLVDLAGRWRYRFEGTTFAQAAKEGQFTVKPSQVD